MNVKKLIAIPALAMVTLLSSHVQAKESYKVCWSHYTGWEPYALLEQTGILEKWEDKYDIDIEITLINDYIESINLYTAGEFDACTMTNMDALTIPAVGGIDSTALILGDFSNGNDGIVIKNGNSVKDLKGKSVKLVELSVSHYLLSRALEQNGLKERDVNIMNTSDADIASVFMSEDNAAVVTWNPPLQVVQNMKGAVKVFDSSEIPEEIMDVLIVKTNADIKLKKALTGAWYELMQKLAKRDSESAQLRALMAANAGATNAEFDAQMKTTRMFYKASEAVSVFESKKAIETMDYVRKFSFEHGLFGNGANSVDFIGIEFPGNKVLGNKGNIKLRFDSSFMTMAANGEL